MGASGEMRILRSYRGESSLTTWLHTIAVRHFTREMAKAAARGRRSAAESAAEGVADAGASPEERIRQLYRLAFGRAPAPEEVQLGVGFVEAAGAKPAVAAFL